ncbi:MAG: hypothetical protein A3F67_04665 [Verrucomicrobia bacterium RIFCSPHIGHO2_12_FULL_41_10]|nr:MAG: hypothetical protein A3F67_04665 [Verrucomicrobia bacterium RIFCSPHIGHO2_12_FULL_41_10]HLB34229.1 Hsp20/alpha crystallin family protein [Chthoniobacterales bacterium]
MKLVYNPFRELNEVRSQLGHLLDNHSHTHHHPGCCADEEELMGIEWSPLVDIIEDEKEYLVKAELPEMKKEEVKISVEKGVLRISGERKSEKEEKGKKFHRIERSYGSFLRSFSIPDTVDEKKIKAEFNNGLLVMHLPKGEEHQKKALEIKID